MGGRGGTADFGGLEPLPGKGLEEPFLVDLPLASIEMGAHSARVATRANSKRLRRVMAV